MKYYSKKNNGFSLLEALLTTIVISGVLLVILGILRAYTEQTLARTTANYVDQIASSIYDILENPLYFQQIYDDADAQANDILEITIPNIINGQIGASIFPMTSTLNANFSNTSPLKVGTEIMLRASAGDTIEVIIVSDARAIDQRVRLSAEQLKLYGGFYRNAAEGIKNAYNAWQFDPNILVGTNWWDNIASLNPPSMDEGSYLVHYRHINLDDVAGDYLYRTDIPGRPELNQMYSALNMGGQNILGVDNLNISGNMDFDSRAIVNGSMNITGDTTLNGANLRAFNQMNAAEANVGGSFLVQNSLGMLNYSVANDLSADEASFTNGFFANDSLTANEIGSINGTIDVQGTTFATNIQGLSAATPLDINVDGQLNVGTITTESFEIDGANTLGVIDLDIAQDVTVGNEVNAPRVIVDVLNTDTFGLCDQGC